MSGNSERHGIRRTLFTVFILIFVATCGVTIWFVYIYLHQTLVEQNKIALPSILKGMIGTTLLEVAAGIFALYKKVFNIAWDGNSGDTKKDEHYHVAVGRERYMENIANEIEKAHREILFTSRTMANSEHDEAQSLIVSASISSNAGGNIMHKGIVCTNPETIRGAVDLKNKAPHIEIRFNAQHLELLDMSYFIVDKKRLILGAGRETTKQSFSIESAALSHMMRNHFNDLWDRSISMRSYIEKTFDDACLEAGESAALEIIGFPSRQDMQSWIDSKLSGEEPLSLTYEDDYAPPQWTINPKNYNAIYDIVYQNIESGTLKDEDLVKYRQLIHGPSDIDYEVYAPAFLYLYFVANYHKVRFSLERCQRDIATREQFRVLDLGCGSGASTLALIDWFYFQDNGLRTLIIDAVDHSEKQLEFHKMILPSDSLRDRITINRIYRDGIEHIKDCRDGYDLIVDGNFFCELESEIRSVLTKCLPLIIKPNGLLLAVERIKSGVYEDLEGSEHFCEIGVESLGPYDIPVQSQLSMPGMSMVSKNTYTVGYALYATEN